MCSHWEHKLFGDNTVYSYCSPFKHSWVYAMSAADVISISSTITQVTYIDVKLLMRNHR